MTRMTARSQIQTSGRQMLFYSKVQTKGSPLYAVESTATFIFINHKINMMGGKYIFRNGRNNWSSNKYYSNLSREITPADWK